MATDIVLNDLTVGTLTGDGVFDKLMKATKAHLEAEFAKGRIKGPEYSTVYLGALSNVMATAMQFVLQQQKVNLEAKMLEQQTLLLKEQTANAVLEGKVLIAQECKLQAEYDVLIRTKLKTDAETALLTQKTSTERAQIQSLGVDDNSVIGKQKSLYHAQTEGFKRDAEQKGTSIVIDTWKARRMTDEATQANAANGLLDDNVGRMVNKLMAGIGA